MVFEGIMSVGDYIVHDIVSVINELREMYQPLATVEVEYAKPVPNKRAFAVVNYGNNTSIVLTYKRLKHELDLIVIWPNKQIEKEIAAGWPIRCEPPVLKPENLDKWHSILSAALLQILQDYIEGKLKAKIEDAVRYRNSGERI